MKLLLTSSGINNQKIRDCFISNFGETKGKKVALIYTIRQESDWQWMEAYDQELKSLGLTYKGINISEEKDLSDIKGFDVYYVCGGNTFYILDRLHKTGLDMVLIDEVKSGKFYIGVSAGSIVVGPDIEVAGIGGADENDVHMVDLTGLRLTRLIISPHYCGEQEHEVTDFKKKRAGEHVVTLTDEQAVLIVDGEIILC
jgi:dipeptidase E